MPNLRILLSEVKQTSGVDIQAVASNIFCFDNESFRFLAALQNGITFPESEQQDFAQSWRKSVETSRKMVEYIMGLPVLNVQDTVSLMASRKIILQLAKPMAEVARNIQVNIKTLEDKKDELNSIDSSLKDIGDKLYIEQIEIENRITKLRKEEEKIVVISAKFAAFTKANAILAFNDDFESFLDLNIREEKYKENASNETSSVLINLLSMKKTYSAQKKIFFDSFAKADANATIAASDITILEKELYAMESFGGSLKTIILNIRHDKNQVCVSHENRHQIKNKNHWTDCVIV